MRLVWYDALLNWLPTRLVPNDLQSLTVIANGKVRLPTIAHAVFPLRCSCTSWGPTSVQRAT